MLTAMFLAQSFTKTGLGTRLAYSFVAAFGGHPLGLAYSLVFRWSHYLRHSSFCITMPTPLHRRHVETRMVEQDRLQQLPPVYAVGTRGQGC